MAEWFLQKLEGTVQTEVGPLRPGELLSLVRRGEIKPETRLRKDDSAWFPARDVGGLFEAAMRQEVRYYCPSCNTRVAQPPVSCPTCLRDIGKGQAREIKPEQMRGASPVPVDVTDKSSQEHQSVQNWLKKKVARKQKG